MSVEPLRKSAEFRKLATAARINVSAFVSEYANQIRFFHKLERTPTLRVGEVKSHSVPGALDLIKVGAILNDICFVSVPKGQKAFATLLTAEGVERIFGTDKISVQLPQNPKLELLQALESGQFTLGFFSPGGDETGHFFGELSPLIELGQVIPRPSRLLIYLEKTSESGQRTFASLEAPLGAPLEVWELKDSASENISTPIPIETTENVRSAEASLCEVVLPFVEHIPTADLALILQDEADVLAEFRAAIRQLTDDVESKGKNSGQILNDIVRPKVSKLERRFRHITNMGRLKIGGAILSTATLTLVSYATAGIAQAIVALGGATGLAYGTKEIVTRSGELEALKYDPMYLLWKVSRKR